MGYDVSKKIHLGNYPKVIKAVYKIDVLFENFKSPFKEI